jgi:predicted Zn-dependent protease
MVQADYAGAAQACTRLAPLTSALIAAACTAYADSMRGRAGPAAQSLRAALDAGAREGPGDAAQRVWALTRLAEIEIRRGETAAAEAAFRAALALDASDAYLLAAWADLLLDQQRPAEAITALAGREAADVLLLRLAIAGRRVQHPDAGRWRDALAERFAAAARRGDALHRKEEARFLLEVIGDPARALPLARENWQRQREETDARLLLQAALAAREPKTAEPALQWMATHGVESRRLAVLAQRLAELK